MRVASLIPAAVLAFALPSLPASGQEPPPTVDPRLYEIAGASSAERIGRDIATLVGFGTRNTLSDTMSATRGIGAARRWIKAEASAKAGKNHGAQGGAAFNGDALASPALP